MIRRNQLEDNKEYTNSIAEFFVMKRYRGKGVGKKMAFFIFDKFPGIWEVSEMKNNQPAQNFWRKIIHEYTQGVYDEIQKENWNGPIQRFRSQ